MHDRALPSTRREPPDFRPAPLLGLVAALAFAGCDIPTELPAIDTRWIVPADETRFGVAELLPGKVTVSSDSSAFIVDFDPVSFNASLGSLCAACAAANGLTVPKPPFLGTFASNLAFPAEVSRVSVVSGQVAVAVQNGLNFDPIRPASGVFGSITITITDSADGDVLGTLVVNGNTTSMAPGTTLNRTMALNPATVNGGLRASVQVNSPAGDAVTMNSNLLVTATATPTNVRVSSVAINVAGRSVDLDPVNLDLEDFDSDLIDRVLQGAFILHVTNPFGVGATFQIVIDGPTIAPIQKSVAVSGAAQTTVTISFTSTELQSFLGQPGVVLSGGAVVSPSAPTITVTPGQELVLSGDLDLTIRIGG